MIDTQNTHPGANKEELLQDDNEFQQPGGDTARALLTNRGTEQSEPAENKNMPKLRANESPTEQSAILEEAKSKMNEADKKLKEEDDKLRQDMDDIFNEKK